MEEQAQRKRPAFPIFVKIVRLHGGSIAYIPSDKTGCKFSMEFSLNLNSIKY